MRIVYCLEWSLYKKQPYHVLSELEAQKKHLNGESYVAVLYEAENVKNVIEIDENSLTVRFYNKQLENYLLYGFIKKDNKLFLNTAYHYVFDSGDEVEQTLFNFKDTGELFMERRNFLSAEIVEREAVVDISCNWADFPEFANYQDIIRVERK